MIIDLDHPIAPHILVLKNGVKMGRVLLIDTELRTARQRFQEGGGWEAVPYDSLAFGSLTPPHIRELLPEVPILTED